MKNNKILVFLLIPICYIVYGSNQVFADRTCANGISVCREPAKTREQAHSEIASYLAQVGVNYDINVINDFRIPWVDCARCDEANYRYEDHKINDVRWNGSTIQIHCVNGAQRVDLIGGGSNSCGCDNWTSERTKCDSSGYTIISSSTNSCSRSSTKECKQTLVWTSTYVSGTQTNGVCSVSCNPRGADDTKVNIITLSGSVQATCGTANGYIYSYNDDDWGNKTLCENGSPSINTNTFIGVGSNVSWTCSDNNCSVSCSASRSTTSCPGCGPTSYCGDGDVDTGEDCDDGNDYDGDACKNNCTIPTTFYCGDGDVNVGEDCDDGNNLGGDGCSSTCSEIGGGYCGDGEVQKPNKYGVNEACDDANNIGDDGCTNSCMLPIIGRPDDKTYCGNGVRDSIATTGKKNYFGFDEECDDGNTNNNDNCTNNCIGAHNSQPGEGGILATSSCNYNTTGSGYANGSDLNTIYATITVKTQENKEAVNLGRPTNFVDLSRNLTDRVYNKGDTSLIFTPIAGDIIVPGDGQPHKVKIATVTSITPFVSCGNRLAFDLAGKTMVLNDVGYNFKKPFIGQLSSASNISLGTKLQYTLSAVPVSSYSNYSLGLKVNNIVNLGENIALQNSKLLSYSGIGPRKFETRINSSVYATALNNQPGVQVVLPVISYKVGGKTVRYYLSTYDYANDRTPIILNGDKFLGVKVIGGLQGAGKYEFTGQGKNISNLYPSNLRTEIRKRAYDYTKKMTNRQVLNRVKYVVGEDIVISGDLDYETLIVKDGNVVISGDLNTSNKKLGIIILKDGYDVNTGYNYKGNILVKPDVTTINAMIYADGAFMSAKANEDKVYYPDSTERTYALQRQLTMNGVLFTRNTIGGAQYVGGYYTIPGGIRTMSYDKSMVYDLNYIRRGNVGCYDSNSDGDCEDTTLGEIKEGFIIKYDSRIQTNPPKLFSK